MIKRSLLTQVINHLDFMPAVALLGCRQVGKTTLAHQVSETYKKPTVYLDLESQKARANFTEPELYLKRQEGKLLILDEIHRVPELFPILRGIIDQRRRNGEKNAHFLILGSASPNLLRQSSESLAGRIGYLELHPFNLLEVENQGFAHVQDRLWMRGGFPQSFLEEDDVRSLLWREDFVRTYIERDLPDLGQNLPAERMYNLWRMLALSQGTTLNLSKLAGNLSVSGTTVRHYIDVLSDLFLVRQLKPWHGNSRKRLVKSPKIYVRDSGVVHMLAGIHSIDDIASHPLYGESWEGFVIEQITQLLPYGAQCSFYGSSDGVEIDLVIENLKAGTLAIEIKRTLSPSISKGFRVACEEIKAKERYYVIPEGEPYPLDKITTAVGLSEFLRLLPDKL
ncbi:MAG: ATP-binding protein [Pseudomonadota bacterium]|nr:ATP-binding protein [Pseudomonadota bacterium]